ncbi:hypothetical protein ACFVXQ_03655 [Kitasatospora sp. NPDC058263]
MTTSVQATTTVEYRPVQGPPVQIEVTSEQLHGRACIVGADHPKPLVPAGHVYTGTAGAPLGWAVVACAGGCTPPEEGTDSEH